MYFLFALPAYCAIMVIRLHIRQVIIPMNFWKSFPKKTVLRQFVFVLVIFAILLPISLWDSGTQVKVKFYAEDMMVKSDRYTMTVRYDQIAGAALEDLADPGEKVLDGFDNDIIRTGTWKNEVWGEYSINADPDTGNCVVMTLTDGRIFVFSCKDDEKTEELYNTLLTYLPKN